MLQCSSKKSVFEVKPFNIDGILHIPYTRSSLGNSLPSLRGSGSPKGTLMGLARDLQMFSKDLHLIYITFQIHRSFQKLNVHRKYEKV